LENTATHPTVPDDVIGFFDELAAQAHEVPRIVVLDNASSKIIDKYGYPICYIDHTHGFGPQPTRSRTSDFNN